MKHLTARQCKDGWAVTIEDTRVLHSLTDVLDMARYEGLRHDKTAKNEVFIHHLESSQKQL